MVHFLRRPYSLPLVLTIFIFLTFIPFQLHSPLLTDRYRLDSDSAINDDVMAKLVRFRSATVAKDNRGWFINPLSLATAPPISGGAVTCASIHIGEIRPGKLRGNHRHHDCNETLVIWGAATKFRLENSKVPDNGYAEVIIGSDDIAVAASPGGTAHALVNTDHIRKNSKVPDNGYAEVIIGSDDIAVAASPSGTAHALVNIDHIRSTFFIACQDSIINYNASSTDINVWKDL